MADDVVSVIREEYLTCQICQSQFEHPKALPCLHSFCEACLREFIIRRRYDEVGHFPCPCCRLRVDLPSDGGVESFPYNHLLVSLLDTISARPPPHNPNIPLIPLPEVPSLPAVDFPATAAPSPASGAQPAERSQSRQRRQPGLALSAPLVPVNFDERNFLLKFGQYGSELTNFTSPLGLAVNDSHIVISDQRDNRIFVFDWRGRLRSLFKCRGQVQDIALTAQGHLLVANDKAGKTLATKYNLNGQKISSLGNMFEFEKPSGIAVINKDSAVVTSVETSTIFMLGPEGKLIQKFRCQAHKPRHVAVGQYGAIAITSRDSHCVRVYDKYGKSVISKIGGEGSGPGQLKQPLGLCLDRYENIVVADAGNHRVQVLSSGGEFRDVVVDFRAEQELRTPVNVAIGRDNRLVMLVVGPDFAEVQVRQYRCPRHVSPGSAPCICQ